MKTITMQQQGFTLVELMVGLVVATLCMIMMLMMFKQVSHIALSSSQDAEYDAQLQTGMLVAEKFIQKAGYGSGKPEDITIGQFEGNDAVFWRFIPDLNVTPTTYNCHGLAEQISTQGSRKVHRLVLIEKINCGDGSAEALTAGTWTVSQAISSIQNTETTPVFRYNLSAGDCRPFGIDKNTAGVKQLTLTASRPHIADAAYDLQSVICLNNIKASA